MGVWFEATMILAIAWYHWILAAMFAVVAVLLMGVILLQRGRGVGLAGAFGGAGGGYSAFGSKTGDILTWVTIVMAGVFLLLAVSLNYAFRPPSTAVMNPPSLPAPAMPGGAAPDQSAPAPAPAPAPSTPAQPPADAPAQSPPAEQPPAAPPSGETPPAETGSPGAG